LVNEDGKGRATAGADGARLERDGANEDSNRGMTDRMMPAEAAGRVLRLVGLQLALSTRNRNSAKLALPYICRLMTFSRFT